MYGRGTSLGVSKEACRFEKEELRCGRSGRWICGIAVVVVLEAGRGRDAGGGAEGKQPHQHDSFMARGREKRGSGKKGRWVRK